MRLMGGLGNQLFQYALARNLSERNSIPFKLDISAYDGDAKRAYRLSHFNIQEEIASPGEVSRCTGVGQANLWLRIKRQIQKTLPYHQRSVIVERSQGFDPSIFNISKDAYLVGYWQSEYYFKDIENLLRVELTVAKEPDLDNRSLLRHIESTNSVSLHVRRGDYVSDPKVATVLAFCGSKYYRQSIIYLKKTVVKPHIFVFSDEPEWARRHLELDYPVTYVELNGTARDYEDLRLMSRCKHHIIANSSFSWWGAWLATFPEKLVIAPARWFNDTRRNNPDLLPVGWVTVAISQ